MAEIISNPLVVSLPFKPRRFWLQVGLALVVLGCANVLIARMVRNSMPRQVIRTIDTNPRATFLASGNSLMAAAFDADIFRRTWDANLSQHSMPGIDPLNIAMGASGPVEHLLLLRHALSLDNNVKQVVYGFYDLQLTDRPTGGWADLTGNRAMSYYVEPYFAADIYAPGSRLELLQIGVIGHVPMLVERLTLWAKVEKMRRRFGEVGLPHAETNQFGRANDFSALAVSDVVQFENDCVQVVQQKLPLTPSVELMIQESGKKHAKFIVIEMPMSAHDRTGHNSSPAWKAYEQYVRGLLADQRCGFIDASHWLDDKEFGDGFHANLEGSATFSVKLAQAISTMRNSDLNQ